MMEKKIKAALPPVGQRIVRSVFAVALCFVLYFLRGQQGIPFYSAIAVLQCIQPYWERSAAMAKTRVTGTLVGALWGLATLLTIDFLLPAWWSETLWYYLVLSLLTGAVIYSTILLRCQNTAYFSCVVFLCITVAHLGDENPFFFVLNRVLDTLIGVGFAFLVNSVHLPRRYHKEILFVSGVDDTLLGHTNHLSAYNQIKLNRMIAQGAAFTISTRRTPAAMQESLAGVQLKLPVIVMDGAALYDPVENEYLETRAIPAATAAAVQAFLEEEQLCYFANVVADGTLAIYYPSLGNEAVRALYKTMRRSPYRSYRNRRPPQGEEVAYFMLLYPQDTIERLTTRLQACDWAASLRWHCAPAHDYPGHIFLRIYDKNATRAGMLAVLRQRLQLPDCVTFGSLPGCCDVLITDSDKNEMVKQMERRFAPVWWYDKTAARLTPKA